jgi:hypothetical protein
MQRGTISLDTSVMMVLSGNLLSIGVGNGSLRRRLLAFVKGGLGISTQAPAGAFDFALAARPVTPGLARSAATKLEVIAHGLKKRLPARAAASSLRQARRSVCFGGLKAKPKPMVDPPQSGQVRRLSRIHMLVRAARRLLIVAGAHALRHAKQTSWA